MNDMLEIASPDAESLILGRMVNSIEDRKSCCEELDSHHFFYKEHKTLFLALTRFHELNKPSELHLLLEHLKQEELVEKVKGVDYIMNLAQTAPSPIHIPSYIEIVKNHWAKREALEEVKKFSAEVSKAQNVSNFLENFSKRFANLSKNLSNNTASSFAEISALQGESGYLSQLLFRREYYQKHQKPFVDGVSTGYPSLDATIGGFGNSNLIILASRPGMGKTALALNLAQRISKNNSIGFISLEMSSIQLYERMLSLETEIPGDVIREGRSNDQEWSTIKRLEPQLSQLPIFIQEGSCFLKELTTNVKQLKEEKNIKILFIDYLQLIRATGETRLMEITNITRDLKNLAMELHIPIVCLAQLSRKVEERTNHRPLLSDLRESGSIEQDADVAMFLLRPDYYDENEKPGEAELIIAKNRHGKTGDVSLHFSKKYAKFDSIIAGEPEDNDFF